MLNYVFKNKKNKSGTSTLQVQTLGPAPYVSLMLVCFFFKKNQTFYSRALCMLLQPQCRAEE